MNKAIPIQGCNWMISPSVSAFDVHANEDSPCRVSSDVSTIPDSWDGKTLFTGGLVFKRVTLEFPQMQALRMGYSDDAPPDYIDLSAVPLRELLTVSTLSERRMRFRSLWCESQFCPDPHFYEIHESEWLETTGCSNPTYGAAYKHYLLVGHDMNVEIISKEFHVVSLSDEASETIDTSTIPMPNSDMQ